MNTKWSYGQFGRASLVLAALPLVTGAVLAQGVTGDMLLNAHKDYEKDFPDGYIAGDSLPADNECRDDWNGFKFRVSLFFLFSTGRNKNRRRYRNCFS